MSHQPLYPNMLSFLTCYDQKIKILSRREAPLIFQAGLKIVLRIHFIFILSSTQTVIIFLLQMRKLRCRDVKAVSDETVTETQHSHHSHCLPPVHPDPQIPLPGAQSMWSQET